VAKQLVARENARSLFPFIAPAMDGHVVPPQPNPAGIDVLSPPSTSNPVGAAGNPSNLFVAHGRRWSNGWHESSSGWIHGFHVIFSSDFYAYYE
jgi:hypothetical protein